MPSVIRMTVAFSSVYRSASAACRTAAVSGVLPRNFIASAAAVMARGAAGRRRHDKLDVLAAALFAMAIGHQAELHVGGTDCSTVRSVSRAISSFGLPSIWPHIEPEASSTMMARSAARPSAAIQSQEKRRKHAA